ncbi:MAG: thioredoxin family protein [Thiohalomonadaceae bacterium]
MEQIQLDTQQFAELLASESALAVYFSADSCSVCHNLYPRIEQMLAEYYPRFRVLKIQVNTATALAAQMGVLSVPTLIIFLDHREQQRYVRQMSVEGLRQDLQRPYALLFD